MNEDILKEAFVSNNVETLKDIPKEIPEKFKMISKQESAIIYKSELSREKTMSIVGIVAVFFVPIIYMFNLWIGIVMILGVTTYNGWLLIRAVKELERVSNKYDLIPPGKKLFNFGQNNNGV